jgi:hypothetical protein
MKKFLVEKTENHERKFVEIDDDDIEVVYRVTFKLNTSDYLQITEEIQAYGEILYEEKEIR